MDLLSQELAVVPEVKDLPKVQYLAVLEEEEIFLQELELVILEGAVLVKEDQREPVVMVDQV